MAIINGGGAFGVPPKELEEFKSEIEQWWDYLYYKYNAEGSEQAGSDGTTVYTETIKDGETVKATRVTTESADGNTFTAVYTIGEAPAKTKTTTITENSFTEVWS